MTGTAIMLVNALVFTTITIWYYKKTSGLNIGSFILGFYALCAWGAFAFHEHELFTFMRGYEKYTLTPFIYLIPTLLLFMSPILGYDSGKVIKAMRIDEQFMQVFAKITLIIQSILFIVLLPAVLTAVMSSNIGDFRQNSYDNGELVKYEFYIFNIIDRLYMGARNVMLIISAYALLFMKQNRTLYKIFCATSFIYPIYHFAAYASRAVMVTQFIFSIFIVLSLVVFINRTSLKKIAFGLIAAAIPLSIFFMLISLSRFGNLASYYFYRYWGESFNNYNAEFYYQLRGHTFGTAYFTLFSKLFGENINFISTIEKWDYLDDITGVDTHIFYTFVGGLNIEFGFVATVLIGIAISYLIWKQLTPNKTMTLPKLILLGMLGYMLINGAFFFVLQGDWGNLEILFTILLYFVFKRYSINKYVYIRNESKKTEMWGKHLSQKER